mmetsp:Transcript_14263/g.54007  ORF Transcript_14263/g.54007 Transcript_14263/m.54007 type:complete len:113 (+) Transcript_14263:94-432(+)
MLSERLGQEAGASQERDRLRREVSILRTEVRRSHAQVQALVALALGEEAEAEAVCGSSDGGEASGRETPGCDQLLEQIAASSHKESGTPGGSVFSSEAGDIAAMLSHLPPRS